MSAKKILYILPQPFFVARGSSFRAMATLAALSELGYHVDLLCLSSGPNVQLKNLRIFRISDFGLSTKLQVGPSWRKLILDIPLAFKALWLQFINRYDLIHGVEEGGMLAAGIGRVFRTPYIFDMHSWMSEQLANHKFMKSSLILQLFTMLELLCMRNSAALITVGQHMAQLLSNMVDNVPVCILYDLPLKMIQDSNIQSKIKTEYANQDQFLIVYTGNFHSYQGIDLLLKSMQKLTANYQLTKPVKLLLVGGGAGETKLIDQYQKQIKQLNIATIVEFCGERTLAETQAFLDCADVLVSPRIYGNNVPLKIYTYLTSGKITVATNISSHTQVLNAENSILADPTPDTYAQALHHALTMPASDKEPIITNALKTGDRDRRVQEFKAALDECYRKATTV